MDACLKYNTKSGKFRVTYIGKNIVCSQNISDAGFDQGVACYRTQPLENNSVSKLIHQIVCTVRTDLQHKVQRV